MKQVKQYFAFVVLAITLLLAGCPSGGPILTADTSAAGRAAETIAKLEIDLTVANHLVTRETTMGVFTKAELKAFGEELDKAEIYLDKAQQAYRDKLFSGSLEDALKGDKLLGTVKKLLANRIKSQRITP